MVEGVVAGDGVGCGKVGGEYGRNRRVASADFLGQGLVQVEQVAVAGEIGLGGDGFGDGVGGCGEGQRGVALEQEFAGEAGAGVGSGEATGSNQGVAVGVGGGVGGGAGQGDRGDSGLRQGLEFVDLRYPVLVAIRPGAKVGEAAIVGVDLAVAIAVPFGQGLQAARRLGTGA
ncbi:MAG: hypothetical protein IPL72_00850 [Sulfuritalea sp.]|nr:hypothetical protein [Sulfuritalea sp.]